MNDVLIVDNLSPFSPDISRCLSNIGVKNRMVRYEDVQGTDLENSGGIILSGRRKASNEINATNSRIVRICFARGKPLLGICYGAEIIALALGGTICRMPAHVQRQMNVSVKWPNPLTEKKNLISVYESHAYCIARLPEEFNSLASSDVCEHEIFSHRAKPIYGTQFHPEKSGPDGDKILTAFSEIALQSYLQQKESR